MNRCFHPVIRVLFWVGMLSPAVLSAEKPDSEGAKNFVSGFFANSSMQRIKGDTVQPVSLVQVYESERWVHTPVFVYQSAGNGFALVVQNNSKFAIAGYSPKGKFQKEHVPPFLESLIRIYEDSLRITGEPTQLSFNVKAAMEPLLDAKGIALNQFNHEYVGGCATGCVATALAQIMAYHKYPEKGSGSHCFTHPIYGDLCADFGNTTYNWVNPTDDDYKLLSYHIGVGMDMNYCGSVSGSMPSAKDYIRTIEKYFKYYVLSKNSTIENELQHARPVYVELPGTPEHAVVVDGYDEEGWYHLNFGWGGNYNGYYPLFNNTYFDVGYKFGTNASAWYISTEASEVNKTDSLILTKIHQAFNGNTGWHLNTPVQSWENVEVLNGRVTGISLRNEYFNALCSIPDEIAGLTELTSLILEDFFTGTLTTEIYKLTKLKNLTIIDRKFDGNFKIPITPDFGNLTELETCRLNKVEGTIPASVGNLKNLENLHLYDGNLTGTIPVELVNLARLKSLVLKNNQLTGAVPASLGQLNNLQTLNLSANRLTQIEAGAWNNSQLYDLALNDNLIEGNLPVSFKNFTALQNLRVQNNKISLVPPEIGMLTNLQRIELQNNQLTAVPAEMGQLTKLTYIDLSNNKIKEIPETWSSLVNLNYLTADSNMISQLPDLSLMTNLNTISMNYNQIEQLPTSLCLLPQLSFVEMSYNKIKRFPKDISQLKTGILYLHNNELSDTLPLTLMKDSVMQMRLDSNYFTYSHIPRSEELRKPLGYQKEIKLTNNTIKVMMGDTVRLDITKLYPLALPDDKYYWNLHPMFQNTFDINTLKMDKELTIVIDEKTLQNKYYCKIINENSPKYYYSTYFQGSYHTGYAPCLDYLNSEPVSFVLASEMDILAEKYPENKVIESAKITSKTIEDNIITLVPPVKVRGTLQWQASADGKTWFDLSTTMTREDLKANLVSSKPDELKIAPKTPAYYRCCVMDNNCEPLYSDTLHIKPLGKVLYDETINVSDASKTIKADSIEVTLPKGLYDKDFRLTIAKLDNPQAASDSVKSGSAYDVTVSFGDVFEMPLVVKLKTLDKSKFDASRIHSYKAAYFDEKERRWVTYDNSYVSLKDTTLNFETSHLTKLRTVQDNGEYDRLWERNNIRVYYKDADEQFINLYKNPSQPWHEAGAPVMVQDVAHFMSEILLKFTKLGFNVPQVFSVYIREMDDDGVVGLLGMKNGYMTINRDVSNAEKLRSLLAHEYMHYTQSDFISPDPGNIFWMESNAHLSDRLIWDETVIPVSESEKYLLDSRKSGNSIYNFLAKSWDYWDSGFWTQNALGNVNYCYLAGTFIHYLRKYSQAEKKLDPVALLKETTSLSGDTWRTYLSNYIAFSMNSVIGDEYENFVKYIIEGTNANFNILREDNPYGYFIRNSMQDSKDNFADKIFYKFDPDESEPQKDQIDMTLPYLSSRVYLMNNSAEDRPVVVTYKQLHDWERENKVYYGYYDFNNQKMNFVDITDSLSYTMFIDRRTEKTKREFRNIAFLLFINKQNPAKAGSESNFEASFELNATPVLNIEDIALVRLSEKSIHTYSDGRVTDFGISGRLDLSFAFMYNPEFRFDENYYSSSKSQFNDSTYTVSVQYGYQIDQTSILNAPTALNIYDIEQTIIYNFVQSSIEVRQKTTNTNKIKSWIELPSKEEKSGWLNSITTDNQTVTFNKISEMNFNLVNESAFGEVIQFSTTSTAATKAMVGDITHTIRRTSFDKTGEVLSVENSNYVSTDFSQEGITAELYLHYK